MKENRGLFFKHMGLTWRVLTVIIVPVLALGILIGGDIASKKVINDLNTTLETTLENAISGSSVPNSNKGTGKQDSAQDILNDYRAYLENQK